MYKPVLPRQELLETIIQPDVQVFPQFLNRPYFGFTENQLIFDPTGERLTISDGAQAQVSSALGVPSPYTAKSPAQLTAINLQFWASRLGFTMAPLVRGGEVVSFVRAEAVINVDMLRIVEAMEAVLGDDLEYHMPHADMDIVNFSISAPKMFEPTKRGDLFRAGLAFQYSPSDRSPMTITGFNYRLSCTNGAYAIEEIKQSRRHPADDIYGWTKDAAVEVWSYAAYQFNALAQAAATRISGPGVGSLVDEIFRDAKVGGEARQAVEDQLLSEGAENMFDLIQHITYVGTHVEPFNLDAREQMKLFSASGRIAEHTQICDGCHRLIK